MIFLNVVVWALIAVITVVWLIVAIGGWFDQGDFFYSFGEWRKDVAKKKRAAIIDSNLMPKQRSDNYYTGISLLLGIGVDFGWIVWLAGVIQIAVLVYS